MNDYTTSVTKVKDYFICRVYFKNKPILQGKVKRRDQVGSAFRDLFRTLDTLGGDVYTSSSRNRKYKEGNDLINIKHEWL